MTRKKSPKEHEELIKENLKLKTENRNLKKLLSRSNKQAKRYAIEEEESKDEFHTFDTTVTEVKVNICPKCSKPTEPIEIGMRSLWNCEHCSYRRSYVRKA